MDITQIREIAADDIKDVNKTILTNLASDVVLINQVGHHIINSGGKRLRPLLVVLAARCAGYKGSAHTELAAIIEFIHTATLLHDDVVDNSNLRRNQATANALFGNEASVLVGDFLYSRSFEMMVRLQNMKVMDVLSHATNRIAEGEVLQLLNCHEPDTHEDSYMEVIERKTATLFEAGTRLAAVLDNQDSALESALANYGKHLGIAFQLVDDALDYADSSQDIGKNIGDDLDEGKPTLPLIRTMAVASEENRQIVRTAIESGGRDHMEAVKAAIASTDAIDYTAKKAREHAELAKQALTPFAKSEQKSALLALADFSVERTY